MTDTTDEQPGISAAIITHEQRVLMVRRRVKEGTLSWQFPAGAIEPGESIEQAAARESLEEAGVTVKAVRVLGERVHPATGRRMAYTACELVSGEAVVGDEEEIAEVAWVAHGEIAEYVPYGLYGPVQEYLDEALAGTA